jgi:hypothetical protein
MHNQIWHNEVFFLWLFYQWHFTLKETQTIVMPGGVGFAPCGPYQRHHNHNRTKRELKKADFWLQPPFVPAPFPHPPPPGHPSPHPPPSPMPPPLLLWQTLALFSIVFLLMENKPKVSLSFLPHFHSSTASTVT